MTDRFLRSQMDNDSYVPIQIIADFPRVKQLTNNYDLIVQVLRGWYGLFKFNYNTFEYATKKKKRRTGKEFSKRIELLKFFFFFWRTMIDSQHL